MESSENCFSKCRSAKQFDFRFDVRLAERLSLSQMNTHFVPMLVCVALVWNVVVVVCGFVCGMYHVYQLSVDHSTAQLFFKIYKCYVYVT